MEGVTTAEAEREQHRRTEHRICFHNAPFTECSITALMRACRGIHNAGYALPAEQGVFT